MYPHLLPGQVDKDAGVRRCISCRRAKKLRQVGDNGVCKVCEPPQEEEPPPEGLEFTCRSCDKKKAAAEFRRRPDTLTGFGYKCRECLLPASCAQCGFRTTKGNLQDGKCGKCLE